LAGAGIGAYRGVRRGRREHGVWAGRMVTEVRLAVVLARGAAAGGTGAFCGR
jgi:NAD-dependent SIR2 family protein deacetylase